jgi:hypothetical protein
VDHPTDVRAEQLQHAPVRLGAPTVIEGEGVTHVYHDVTYPDPLDANRRDRRSLLGRVARSCCLIDLRDGAVMSGDRDLTDQQWAWIEPLLPSSRGKRSRPFRDHRPLLDGII